jgi:hypothetical protein
LVKDTLIISPIRLDEIRECCTKASPGPWEWRYTQGEEPTDDPELSEMGIGSLPTYDHIQLVANGRHRFWIEMTDTGIGGDCVFDFDFIIGAREYVPELLAEIDRLKKLAGESS